MSEGRYLHLTAPHEWKPGDRALLPVRIQEIAGPRAVIVIDVAPSGVDPRHAGAGWSTSVLTERLQPYKQVA